MELNLQQKVFVITGGASGIGAGIARALAGEGAIPVLLGRNREMGEALIAELGVGTQIVYELDSIAACRAAVQEILAFRPRIDGLVNNAGANDGVGLLNGSPEAFELSLRKNLCHYYHLTHLLVPQLRAQRGVILNISSKTAVTGQGGTSAYAAAKGAQLALTREWAVELLPYHIRVNAILPAEVMTPLYQTWLQSFPDPAAQRKVIEQNIPLAQRM
ncbi:MAG: SDR family NAD(P)-dependent oxidoreductase, partial [Bacteroidota bacterium]